SPCRILLCVVPSLAPPAPLAFPTRRSSDLRGLGSNYKIGCFDAKRPAVVPQASVATVISVVEEAAGLSVLRVLRGETRCVRRIRSEEHTSELQSRENLVCRRLREKREEARR